jgi:hypothetical protein
MRPLCNKNVALIVLVMSAFALSHCQSLGDIAREQRQKQQANNTQTARKVVTNEDLPEHADADESAAGPKENSEASPSYVDKKSAEQWQSEIKAQKQSVANLQSQVDRLNSSIHFAPGNCVRNCVQYNEHQVQKQDEVQRMQAVLDEQKKKLEDMQEAARKQGYGNAVYEPQ